MIVVIPVFIVQICGGNHHPYRLVLIDINPQFTKIQLFFQLIAYVSLAGLRVMAPKWVFHLHKMVLHIRAKSLHVFHHVRPVVPIQDR